MYSDNDKLMNFDRRKNIKYKCASCKREWHASNFRDLVCIYCKSDKIIDMTKK